MTTRRAAIREREQAVKTRVDEINQRLKYLSRYTVTCKPSGPENWLILPTFQMFQNEGFPIFGGRYLFLVNENLNTSSEKLIFTRFRYRLKKSVHVPSQEQSATNGLPVNWEFRYEFDPRGDDHAMPSAGRPEALRNRRSDRHPPYHVHVYEDCIVGSGFHYPLGTPKDEFELLFEVIRLIRDEFIEID